MQAWHTQDTTTILRDRDSSPETGLTAAEAARRLQQHGPNELKEKKSRRGWKMLLDQFTETMVLILIVAAVISGFLGKETETIAIAAIVVLFALLGFFQEYRAEKAMAALKQMAVPLVQVKRDGVVKEIPSRELVPGDIISLEAGNIVPADARLLDAVNLKVQESALTGEAVAVEKSEEALTEEELPLGDRLNMVYSGTTVTYGRATAVVVATGMETELGRIAGMLQEVDTRKTPLQYKLSRLGITLAIAGGVAAGLVFLIGILRGETMEDMFLVAISLAVAVVPEGLPAVVTITLALGAQKMLKRNALVRKLPAVETLGSVTVICSDKTGTLTENKMTVTLMEIAGKRTPFPPENDEQDHDMDLPVLIGTLCNDTRVQDDQQNHFIGDPTETALVAAAEALGITKQDAEARLPRVKEIPFDSERMRMTTIHRLPQEDDLPFDTAFLKDSQYAVFTKGAVDGLLTISGTLWTREGLVPLDDDWKRRILDANQDLAQNGIRVLGLAAKGMNELPQKVDPDTTEKELIFIGLVGMIDPPRPAVRDAIAQCRAAGIRTIMITGDHPLTAAAIAADLQLADNPATLAGDKLTTIGEAELDKAVREVSVFARVTPQDKLRIVRSLQNQGEVVAMTGDGVNDSPALRKADIGVAMGITGTGVAREASEMVLLDDNFTTIVAAVEEGRSIFDNLLRFIRFSLGGNLGKVLVMLLAPFLGMTVALQPLQLLWLNLLTDGLMGLGLGTEPAEKDVMQRPPRAKEAPILDQSTLTYIAWSGVLIGTIALGAGYYYFEAGRPEDNYWQTMLFATLGFAQIGQAIGLRTSGASSLSFTSNPMLTFLTLLTIALQLAVIYLPFLDEFFLLRPLAPVDLALSASAGLLLFAVVRLEGKWRLRRRVAGERKGQRPVARA